MKRAVKFIIVNLLLFSLISCGSRNVRRAPATYSPGDAIMYAKGFSIDSLDGFISVTIRNPWDTLQVLERYLLVDRTKPLPANLPEGTVVKVPVERAAVYTSVHAALMEQIGCLDALCGVCEPEYITSCAIRKRIDDGSIADLGQATAPNIEKMMDLKMDVIIASPYKNSGFGAAEKMVVPIIQAADYLENHPLGRTEWVRFLSLLFCKPAVGDSIFNATKERYEILKSLAEKVDHRPTVLLERKYGSSWLIPSGSSYIGVLQEDAGADYLFKERVSASNTVPISVETVLDKASDARFWLLKYSSDRPLTYKDLADDYPPYAELGAFKNHCVYACNTLATSYYDDITLHPDLVLEDLIAIFHPELLPEHSFRYYFPLQEIVQ